MTSHSHEMYKMELCAQFQFWSFITALQSLTSLFSRGNKRLAERKKELERAHYAIKTLKKVSLNIRNCNALHSIHFHLNLNKRNAEERTSTHFRSLETRNYLRIYLIESIRLQRRAS